MMRSLFRATLGFGAALAILGGCGSEGSAPADPDREDEVTEKPPAKNAPAKAADATGGATLDLGEVDPGREVTFEVPEGTLGFNLAVTGDPGWHVGLQSLVSPSGERVVTDFVPEGGEASGALGSRGLAAFSVPQTDRTATRANVEPGSWKLVVGGIVPDPNAPTDKSAKRLPAGDPVTAKLRVAIGVQRTNDGAFHGGELDLHVYVPDGLSVQDPDPIHEITADDAANDASLNRRVELFYGELSRLFGIGRGAVTFHRIGSDFLRAETGEARASLIAQAGTRANGLHVVLTNQLSYTDGDPLLGYSVGLPGVANVPSTVRSAIAVALYPDQTATNDAVTFLHEMGHFVGLMHTTEDDGTPDLLADTPICSGKGRCGDVNNLMTPAGPKIPTQGVVSASQVRVVQGSPIYRAFPTAR